MTLLRHLARQATVSKMPYKTDERGNTEFNEKGELIQVKASDDHQAGNGTASLTPQHTESFSKSRTQLDFDSQRNMDQAQECGCYATPP